MLQRFFLLIFCISLIQACTVDSNGSELYIDADKILVTAKKAILNADHQGLKAALKQIDVNQPLADGSSLLAWGVESQDPEMVELLLSGGAQINTHHDNSANDGADANPFSPLVLACQYGNADIINQLLAKGADVNAVAYDAISVLQLCSGSAPVNIIESMIEAGAVVDATNDQGQTPLMWAAAHGQTENMQLLLEHGADINKQTLQGFTPLFFAIKSKTLATPMVAIKAGADLNQVANDGTSAIQLAMYQHNYDFAYLLIQQGVNLEEHDRHGHQLLHSAVLANQSSLVSLLIEQGANPNTPSGPSTLKWRYEANFKTEDYIPPLLTPLYMAAENGFTDIMQLLIKAGASPEFVSEDENNIVLAAAFSGQPATLSYALELLPQPKTKNKRGLTPLDIVLMHNSSKQFPGLLAVLEKYGVEIDPVSVGR